MKFKLGTSHIIIKKRFFVAVLITAGLISAYFLLGERVKERNISGLEKAQVEILGNSKSNSNQSVKQKAIEKLKENYKNKFVIIFFYDGYKDQNEALNYIAVMKATLDIIEPFKTLKQGLVFKTFTTDSEKCRVQDLPAGRQETLTKILVCDEKLIDSFRNLGIDRFKLVILSPLEFSSTALPARGSNSWMTVSTNLGNRTREENKKLIGLMFAQNLGRSLGLASEGVASDSAQTKSLAANLPNCVRDSSQAEALWGAYLTTYNIVGYFKGCAGNPDFIYPEKDTLMSSSPRKESYGKVSEDYLRGILSCYYMDKDSLIFGAGEEATYSAKLSSCNMFKKEYPSFWTQ